jgi:hypothetical protein
MTEDNTLREELLRADGRRLAELLTDLRDRGHKLPKIADEVNVLIGQRRLFLIDGLIRVR